MPFIVFNFNFVPFNAENEHKDTLTDIHMRGVKFKKDRLVKLR